jgi:hypothetical protein
MKQLVAKDQRDLHTYLNDKSVVIDGPVPSGPRIKISLINSSGNETTYGGYTPMTLPLTRSFWNFEVEDDGIVLRPMEEVTFPICTGNPDDIAKYKTEIFGDDIPYSGAISGVNNVQTVNQGTTISFGNNTPELVIHRGNSTYGAIHNIFST